MNPTPFQVSSDDLDNCAREPIHLTTFIQPHGFLFACRRDDLCIEFASVNVETYIGLPAAEVLGTPIERYLKEDADFVRRTLAGLDEDVPKSVHLNIRARQGELTNYEVLAHASKRRVIIEFMPFTHVPVEIDNRAMLEDATVKLGTLHNYKSLPAFLDSCVDQIRHISGYQRVILYRFLPDWSGEVLAESVQEGYPPRFKGLRFPASDIPAQARELYRTNTLRVIGDAEAEPVAIVGAAGADTLDQSHSMLRSPSPVHLVYMRNMGVRASMTVSLLKDGELWGMITCHHDEPRLPPSQIQRIAKMLCVLVAEMAILRIDILERREAGIRLIAMRKGLNRLTHVLHGHEAFGKLAKTALREIAPILNAQEFGLVLDGQMIHAPRVSDALKHYLLMKAERLGADAAEFTHCMSDDPEYPPGSARRWAGVALIRIPGVERSYLWFLREQVERQIRWAGAPSKTVQVLPDGMRVVGPRESFTEWQQAVLGQSDHWSADEKDACLEVAREIADTWIWVRSKRLQSDLGMLGSCMARLNDMVVVTDAISIDEPGPRIIYVNDAFVAGTGYQREEVLGRSPRILQGPDTQREPLDAIRAALTAWRPVTVELLNYRKDGSPYWAELAIAPVADSTGWYTHWVAIQRDIGERRLAQQEIQQLVFYDPLTGLPNRRMLTDRLRVAISTAHRFSRTGALMFIDLDNFKDLNDTAGHDVGDELLRQVARRFQEALRTEDTVARLGGDEFVVMIEGLSPEPSEAAAVAQHLAEKLIANVSRPFDLRSGHYTPTASIGLTLLNWEPHTTSVEELLKQADIAMYQAKAAGRNAWRFYDPEMQAELVARNMLESRLKSAFEERRLEVHYQPIFNAQRAAVGVEALVRWNEGNLGWVSPERFIPLAEANGLIVPIGLWVLEDACRLLRAWEDQPDRSTMTV
ncbi:MAG TPA: diguanylate cyclase, partial [Dyella sp.]|nr:diguanylate cyclase [Dyella sp.]